MFRKYYLIDENLRICGKIKYNGNFVKVLSVLSVLSFAAVIALVCCIVRANGNHAKACLAYEKKYDTTVTGLKAEIDYANTMTEECGLHTEIGRRLISKETVGCPTRDEVWEYINELKPWYPDIIMAQAIQESSCGKTSPKGTNNLFGMGVPAKRETTALNAGQNDKYSVYKDWKMSVIDRVLWELYVFNYVKPTRSHYMAMLGNSNYAKSEGYGEKIEKISKDYR